MVPSQTARSEILCIADTKWVLGHWHMAVMPNGKTFDDFTAIAALMQEELGHTRALFGLLGDQENGASLEHDRSPEHVHSMITLNDPPRSWADYVGTTMLVDYATWEMLAAFAPNSLVPPSLIEKIGQEERFHQLAGIGWLKSLSDDDRATLQKQLPARFAEVLRWFGPSGDDPLVAAGVRAVALDEVRRRFLATVAQSLGSFVRLEPGSVAQVWDDWDPERRRPEGSGIPAQLWEMMIPTNAEARMTRRSHESSESDGFYATG